MVSDDEGSRVFGIPNGSSLFDMRFHRDARCFGMRLIANCNENGREYKTHCVIIANNGTNEAVG